MSLLSGLVDKVFGGGSGAAADAMSAGYDQAMDYQRPFYKGGLEDYNKLRGEIGGFGDSLQGYGNPYDWNWQQASKDPKQFYEELMNGYTETPQAKYLQDQAQKSVTQGASAAGTLGSGSMYKALQKNAYDLSAQDMDRYLQNILGVNQRQMEYGNNYQGEQNSFRTFLQNLANMGQQSATQMGQYAIGQGNANAQGESGRAEGWDNLINFGAGLLFG